MTHTLAGSSTSGSYWISTGVGTTTITPPSPIGDMLTLAKTATGEFVLSGANAQQLLMEYFEQSPELWLRLLALKAEKEENNGNPA